MTSPVGWDWDLLGEASVRVCIDARVTTKLFAVQMHCGVERNALLCFPTGWKFQTRVCLSVLRGHNDLFIFKKRENEKKKKQSSSPFDITVVRQPLEAKT